MNEPALGIDVSKDTLDVSIIIRSKIRALQFANSPEGWRSLGAWLRQYNIPRVHACLEATGRYSLGVALALHDAGHVVSVVNPAQIRDFARSKLGRNKTDKVDSTYIRDYVVACAPPAWIPPSPALRRLCDLRTMRDGFVASHVEWRNRVSSAGDDPIALQLAQATIAHLQLQIAAVDKAIAQTIDEDDELRGKRDLLLSINGVGETLAAVILAELPTPELLKSSAQAVAYAGLNPRRYQSGTSLNLPTRISKIGNAKLRTALFMPAMAAMRHNPIIAAMVQRLRQKGRLKGKQIVIAAMRKLLVLCFDVLKTRKSFEPNFHNAN